MATVLDEAPSLDRLQRKVFRFDWITSWMMSILALVGTGVGWLLFLTLSSQEWKVKTDAVPVDSIAIAPFAEDSGAEGMFGNSPELGEGGSEDNALETPPAAEQVQEKPEVANVMTDVLSLLGDTSAADFADPTPMMGPTTGPRSTGRPGKPGGRGRKGTGEGGGGAIPRNQRWVVIYNTQTLEGYAQQLDFFGIEIGVIRGRDQFYVTGVARRPVVKTTGEANRLYFLWQEAKRLAADKELVTRAGSVPTVNVIFAHFYPKALEDQLAKLEKAYANRNEDQIRQTKFGIRRAGGGFEFYVQNQLPL